MKRMNHGGSLGSQHQLQQGLVSNQVGRRSSRSWSRSRSRSTDGDLQILGSGQNLMGDYNQQEKGILKKPGAGVYCPSMDKDRDRWDSFSCS